MTAGSGFRRDAALSWWVKTWHGFEAEVGLVSDWTYSRVKILQSVWIHHRSVPFVTVKQSQSSGPLWISSLIRHRVRLMNRKGGVRRAGRRWAEVLWAASKGSKVVALEAAWLNKIRATRNRHVLVTAVMEMGQLCRHRPPPGPWSDRTLGPGWGSGLWSRRMAVPAPRSPQTVPTEARTTPPDRRSLWYHPAFSFGGGLS